ncbi:efflux RND transporter periplasmic adaptor subunit, partial [Thermodesulfobacteriota bacterium]
IQVKKNAGSVQDVERAGVKVDLAKSRLAEARIGLEESLLDLKACAVKAPFSGYMVEWFKNPFEAITPLEKVFAIVDVHKVYAVANVPLSAMAGFNKGDKAVFAASSGKRFVGIVERTEKVVDPRSETKKVHVLIDNAESKLEVGMTGYLQPDSEAGLNPTYGSEHGTPDRSLAQPTAAPSPVSSARKYQ